MNVNKKAVIRKFTQKKLLREWYLLLTASERKDFFEKVGTTNAYIMQIYGGHSVCSTDIALSIQEITGGTVPAWYLRPDQFERHTNTN
jgi:hypothetical protein